MSKQNETIEDKMVRLRQMTAWFDSDEFSLDLATKMFEDATKLAREIEHDLHELKNTVTVLKKSFEEA